MHLGVLESLNCTEHHSKASGFTEEIVNDAFAVLREAWQVVGAADETDLGTPQRAVRVARGKLHKIGKKAERKAERLIKVEKRRKHLKEKKAARAAQYNEQHNK